MFSRNNDTFKKKCNKVSKTNLTKSNTHELVKKAFSIYIKQEN